MRFQVNRDVFSEAVSFVVKLLPQRNPQPILAGVLIEAGDNGLTLSAFDYEASARTTIEATVDEPGTILVHGRLLSDIASRLPNAPIEISVEEDGGIAVRCGSARFTLASMPVEEYPSIPEVTGTSGLVPADEFGQRGDVLLLDIGYHGGCAGALDIGDVLGVADHRGDLITPRDQQRSEQKGDAAVTAEHDDAGHGSRLALLHRRISGVPARPDAAASIEAGQ